MNTDFRRLLEELEDDDQELARQLLGLRQRPSAELRRRVQSIPQQKARWSFAIPRLARGAVAVLVSVWLLTSPVALATLGRVQGAVGQVYLAVARVLPTQAPVAIGDEPASPEEIQLAMLFNPLPTHYVPDPDDGTVPESKDVIILDDLDSTEEIALYDSQMAGLALTQEQDMLLIWKADTLRY